MMHCMVPDWTAIIVTIGFAGVVVSGVIFMIVMAIDISRRW